MGPQHSVLLIAWLMVISIPAANAQQHPMQGAHDPYRGFTRADGKTSCCGGHDCAPAAWDEERGLIQLPDGTWVDPWSHVNQNQTRPALYFSFDRHAHACLSQGLLHCVFVPGSSASRHSNPEVANAG